jgi:carboxylesterase type B
MGTASSVLYGPDYFLQEDIVLVSIAYRIGILGKLLTTFIQEPSNRWTSCKCSFPYKVSYSTDRMLHYTGHS